MELDGFVRIVDGNTENGICSNTIFVMGSIEMAGGGRENQSRTTHCLC